MNKFQQLIVALIALGLNSSSFAKKGEVLGAATVATTTAIVYGIHTGATNAYASDDLDDWENKSLKLAVDLDRKCQVSLDARLYNTNRKNVAVFILKNDNISEIFIDYKNITFAFDGTQKRSALKGAMNKNYYKIDAHTYKTFSLSFPAKSDFKSKKELVISIPFKNDEKTCTLQAKFQNDPKFDEPKTYISAATFEMNFDAGALVAKSGDNKHLFEGDENLVNFNFEFYKSPLNGFYFGFNSMTLTGDLSTINSKFEDPSEKEISRLGLDVGYVRRGFFKGKWSYRAYLGAAVAGMYDVSDTRAGKDSKSTVAGLNIKYFIHYQTGSVNYSDSAGEWGLGFGLNAYHWLSGEIADQSLKGTDVSLQLRVFLGM